MSRRRQGLNARHCGPSPALPRSALASADGIHRSAFLWRGYTLPSQEALRPVPPAHAARLCSSLVLFHVCVQSGGQHSAPGPVLGSCCKTLRARGISAGGRSAAPMQNDRLCILAKSAACHLCGSDALEQPRQQGKIRSPLRYGILCCVGLPCQAVVTAAQATAPAAQPRASQYTIHLDRMAHIFRSCRCACHKNGKSWL